MGEAQLPACGYMTVGEAARRAGVTVRSLQYYDQQGVLSPSAKGPQNQRLYTPEDLDRLSCVLCLKYAGLSLGAIKEFLASGGDAREVFADALHQTEQAFSSLLRRYAVLGNLRGAAESAAQAGERPDWQAMAHSVETGGEEGEFFWRLSCIYDERPGEDPDEQHARCSGSIDAASDGQRARRPAVAAWHEVIAEAVGLMRAHEPLDSARSRQVAAKVVRLRQADAARPADQRFLLLENMPAAPGNPHDQCFGDLRQEMSAYLDRLVEAYERAEAAAPE